MNLLLNLYKAPRTCQRSKTVIGRQERRSSPPPLGTSSLKHNNLTNLSNRSVKVGKELQAHQDLQRKGRTYISLERWGKITGKDPQFVDWGKDSSDKFYSLTEESDLSSGDHSSGGSEDSETSEAENKLSSNEPTVRQLRRKRKSVKTRPCSQEGLENSTATGGRTLKWDYSGIGLADSPTISNQGSVNGNVKTDTGAPACNSSTMGTEAGMLQSIYSSIKELQTETRIESRRARIATKRLQGKVRKVAKSCTEIEAKLCSMEERIVAVEEDVDTVKEQSATRDEQLTDVMWKLEDFENRQRRNNLRFLGIPEGLEGSNIRTYMVNLLRGAFPELGDRDWENELQRVHRFPATRREGANGQILNAPELF
ncbi:hypothetical protein NDU88_009460 [Pleurodeles waltl]|uniref:Uncharacterized protein n=1 Tax=Pleurodeles waltl TaxID=8319 RepID=A0AAV7QVV4_PLEWA|nr:hypothetical protein NDU88_009460 [Pleurodeles waltl]